MITFVKKSAHLKNRGNPSSSRFNDRIRTDRAQVQPLPWNDFYSAICYCRLIYGCSLCSGANVSVCDRKNRLVRKPNQLLERQAI